MASFIYAPAVRMRIESSDATVGIVDVSRDVSQLSLTRRANAISTTQFTLNNTQRKYDRIFRPGDKITIEMKRITWVRVFTGTLNEIPVFASWPQTINLSASCTLKKLQMFYWDSTSSAAQDVITQFFAVNSANAQGNVSDGGASVLLTEILDQVTHWPKNKVHIGQIPTNWFEFAEDVNALITGAESMQAVLGSGALIGGSFNGAIPLAPGTYDSIPLDQQQIDNIVKIYGTVRSRGLPDQAAIIALMTVGTESRFRILANTTVPESESNPNKQGDGHDHDSVGLFQQRASWGSVAQRMDASASTVLFLNRMVNVPSWQTADPATVCQTVQVSQFPDAYRGWESFAKGIVQILSGAYKGALEDAFNNPTAPGTDTSGNQGTGVGTTTGKHTGAEIASVAYNLIKSKPPGHIAYSQSNDADATVEDPLILDCSSLVDWVYYHTVGSKWFSPRGNSREQAAACIKIPIELAKKVQGSLVFIMEGGGPGSEGHVAVSLGNGQIAEAATDTNPRPEQVHVTELYSSFNEAGLIPGIDYSNAATDQASANQLATYTKGATGVGSFDSSGSNITAGGQAASSPLQALIQLLSTSTNYNGDVLGGARALANDQPIFPWIANLANSSMRSVASGPNGDFIAWFPDYFGIWGTAAKMNIELIELQDFEVTWSDQQIVTHQYVSGVISPYFESTSGGTYDGSDGSYANIQAALQTSGVVTMDYPQIFKAIFGKEASKSFTQDYMKRFGGRPSYVTMSNITPGKQEFFMALWLFMQAWANQFTASVPMTFMPELFPGMLLCIPEYGFQAYVEEVTHRISFGKSGGFYTDVQISAPARTSDTTDVFGLLPLAGPVK